MVRNDLVEKLKQLLDSLHYMNMKELQAICTKLSLPYNGKKGDLIRRIYMFIETGQVEQLPQIPAVSKVRKGIIHTLSPRSFILFGSYKNDAKTRAFFKDLIGNHFHFTAYGIDWIEERWLKGNPPTYQEFAEFWQQEYLRRKKEKAHPKQEWAYIRFVQRYIQEHPNAGKKEILNAWKLYRQDEVKKAVHLIASLLQQ